MAGKVTYPPILETEQVTLSRSGYKPLSATTILTLVSLSKSRTGYSLPERFTHLKASGFMPATDYSGVEVNKTLSPGTSSIRFGSPTPSTMTHTDTFYCESSGKYNLSDSRAAKATTIATANANQALRDQSMSLIETSYEGRKTLKMVLDGATTLKRGLTQIKRGDFTGAAATFGIAKPRHLKPRRNVSGNWLEYRYGWMPVIYEVNGALEHLRKNFSEDRVLVVKGTGVVEVAWSGKTTYSLGSTGNFDQAHITFRVRQKTTGAFKANVGYYYRITNKFAVQSQSLGLTNLPLTALELTTLSFVADWFVNVSDVLAQLDAWVGKEFLGGFSTVKYHEDTSRVSELISVAPTYTSTGFVPAVGTCMTDSVLRVPLSQQPTFGLVIRPQLNLRRLLDAAALFRQFTR